MKRQRSASSARTNATSSTSRTTRSNKTNKAKSSVVEYPCFACYREGVTKEASNYCAECAENLCETCVKQHKKFPAMRYHTILPRTDMKPEGNTTTNKYNPQECPLHPGKKVDTFCEDHGELSCSACIIQNHRQCKSTILLEDAATGVTASDEYLQVTEAMNNVKDNLTSLKKQLQQNIKRFGSQKSAALKAITTYRKELDKALDELENTTVREVEQAYTRELEDMNADVKRFTTVIFNLDALTSMLEKAVDAPDGGESTIFVGVKRARMRIDEGKALVESAKNTLPPDPIRFTADSRILNWIKSLQQLGQLSYQQMQFTGSLMEKYEARASTDEKSCDIFGCAIFADGRVLLSDWDNKNVKLLDKSYTVLTQCLLPGNPTDICSLNPQEAVVSLTNLKLIQFLSVANTEMKLTRSFTTEEHCRGIGYHGGKLFVVCGGFKKEDSGKVRVYSVVGDLIRTIERNNSGQRIFISPIAIAITSNGKFFHISDGYRGIITVTHNNDVVSVVSNTDVQWPCGICGDRYDNAIACSGQSSKVVQIKGRNKMDILLTEAEGIKKPHSICYDSDNLRLIVTMEKSKYIYVYQLKLVQDETAESPMNDKNHVGKLADQSVEPKVTPSEEPKLKQPPFSVSTAVKKSETVPKTNKVTPKAELKPKDNNQTATTRASQLQLKQPDTVRQNGPSSISSNDGNKKPKAVPKNDKVVENSKENSGTPRTTAIKPTPKEQRPLTATTKQRTSVDLRPNFRKEQTTAAQSVKDVKLPKISAPKRAASARTDVQRLSKANGQSKSLVANAKT